MISFYENDSLCFVLSCSPYSEDSAMVTLVGEKGIFSVLARGIYKAKSQLKPLLIIGNLVKLDFREGKNGFGIAHSVSVVEDNSILSSDYHKSCFLLFLQELSLDLFHYGDSYPTEEIYRILNHLCLSDDILSSSLLVIGIFCRSLGVDVHTDQCVFCKKTKEIVTYELTSGGFVCKDCALAHHLERKSDLSLYVLKFAFSPLTDRLLAKSAPTKEGILVLKDLLAYLSGCFDLKRLKSSDLLLEAIEESRRCL